MTYPIFFNVSPHWFAATRFSFLSFLFSFVGLGVLSVAASSFTVSNAVGSESNAEEVAPFLAPWSEDVPFPSRSELTFPEGCEHFVVFDAEADPDYKFLHETAIGFCGDELVVAWYHNPENELAGKTFQRERRSVDGGKTWSDVQTIFDRGIDDGLMYVGVQFFNVGDDFFALTNQEKGAERPVDAILLQYDRAAKRWNELGPVAPRFLSMQQPIKNAEGNWIVSGSYNPKPGDINGYLPCVYVSRGDDVSKPWRRFLIDDEYVNAFAETAIVVENSNVLAVTRIENNPFPNFYESRDFGRTWRKISNAVFPATAAKFAAGTLSNGTRYIVFNAADFQRDADGKIVVDGMNRDRATLAIALAKPGETAFSKIYKLSDPTTPTNQKFSHYPCVVEQNGKLYVSYTGTHNRRNVGLAVVPIDSLR